MWLVIRTGPDAGSSVELPADAAFVLGRQRGCDLIVRDSRASRRHAELRPGAAGTLSLRDLGSANGTYLDGSRIEDAPLTGGEEIRIGDVVIDVRRSPPAPDERRPLPSAIATPAGLALTVGEYPQLAT